MDTTGKLSFQEAAIASGLVEVEVLLEIYSEIGLSADEAALESKQEGRLKRALLERKVLNHWQVEQLQEGRTKFTLGPYRIVDSLGKGGMGHVFKAQHEMLGRIEAIKVLPKERSSQQTIESFQREIRAQAQLDHVNLVRVSYAGQEGDIYFLVTEYVPGTDLRHLVRRHGRLTMHEAATIISQAAQGLSHAHEKGLVHRDVKPGNLLVTPDGKTKVTDLGLAWHLNRPEESDVYAGKLVGTVDYLAPELIRSPGDPLPVSDIYSLGCTLYYAVTGKVPFPGGKTADKLRRHLEEAPLNPRRFNPDLSDMFLDVMADMMEKDSVRRLKLMEAVIERLRPWSLANVGLGTPPEEACASSAAGTLHEGQMPSDEIRSGELSISDLSVSDASERPSQISQATVPFTSWREDTDSINVRPRKRSGRFRESLLPASMVLLILLAITSVLALLLILVLQGGS